MGHCVSIIDRFNRFLHVCGIPAHFMLLYGTSIGSNLTEAEYSITKKDFLAKVYISYKESAETQYWLNLLYKSDYLTAEQFDSLNNDCVELLKLLTSITKTTKNNLEKNK